MKSCPELWSIGLYSGPSPFALRPALDVSNPILTAGDVDDVAASFVADPFLVRGRGCWYLFFEVLNRASSRGEIGLATSADLREWRYCGIIHAEPFHLSFPHVFAWHSAHYMVAETHEAGEVRLYRSRRFPGDWVCIRALLRCPAVDATIFRSGGWWWMLACTAPRTHDVLRLFLARDLEGDWIEHPASPLVDGDATKARPGGRVFWYRGALYRLAQDCGERYGHRVRAIRILELTPRSYREGRGMVVLRPGSEPWNRTNAHHLDLVRIASKHWLAAVDGYTPARESGS